MTENIHTAEQATSFMSMLHTLTVPVIFTDENSLIRFVNPVMHQLLGYKPAEILHLPTAIFF
ncbi:MAG: PAS domain-containing protein [Ferruginibacter sp.]